MRLCALLLAAAAMLPCQDNLGVLPEGPGLAAKYGGDAGVAKDPAVVVVEDFRSGALEELRARWSDVSNREGRVLAFSEDVPAGSAGGPFEGFRWRADERVKVNRLWLSHYVTSDSAFPRTDKYAAAHPAFKVNLKEQSVWFANLVAATEYVGPLGRKR